MTGNVQWVATTEIAGNPLAGLEVAVQSARNATSDNGKGALALSLRLAETPIPYAHNKDGKQRYDEQKANAFLAEAKNQWAGACKTNIVQWANLGIIQYAEYKAVLDDTGLHGNGVYYIKPTQGFVDMTNIKQYTDKATAIKQALEYTYKNRVASTVFFSNGKSSTWYPVAFANVQLVRTSVQMIKPKQAKNWVIPMNVYAYFGWFTV